MEIGEKGAHTHTHAHTHTKDGKGRQEVKSQDKKELSGRDKITRVAIPPKQQRKGKYVFGQ